MKLESSLQQPKGRSVMPAELGKMLEKEFFV